MKHILLTISLILGATAVVASDEEMICKSLDWQNYEVGKPVESSQGEPEKTYIAISDGILAMNYQDNTAQILKLVDVHEREILGVVNRKFIKASDFNLQVVIIGGARCSIEDKDQRKVLWVRIYEDGYESEALSCACR